MKADLIIKSHDLAGPVEVNKDVGKICGYASVFNVLDHHKDMIVNGAFSKIDPSKVKLLWQHDQSVPIGKITKLVEDYWGLYMEAEFTLEVEKAREAYALVKAGAISGLSIGFDIKSYNYDSKYNRIIDDIDLWEVSLVTFPANQDANITDYKGRENMSLKNLGMVLDKATKLLTLNGEILCN